MKIIYPRNFSKSRNSAILKYCEGKKVLHVGACDCPFTKEKYTGKRGSLLYREIDAVCKEQLGIDLDRESIDFLNSKKNEFPNSKINFFDMNRLENLNYKPDIIIFGEVIEHLMNLEIALTNLKKVMNKDTLLIISTPNALSFILIINSLFGFEYIHPDHKVIFTYGNLLNLLKFNQIDIKKAYFTNLDSKNIEKNFFGKIIHFIGKIFNRIFISTNNTLLIIGKIK